MMPELNKLSNLKYDQFVFCLSKKHSLTNTGNGNREMCMVFFCRKMRFFYCVNVQYYPLDSHWINPPQIG